MLSKYALNNYRMAGYLLIAVGLINLRYQSGDNSVLTRSLLIVLPGALILALTFIKGLHGFLAQRATMYLAGLLGLVLLYFAVIN